MKIEAYTDGGTSPNPGPSGIGIVLIMPDGRLEVSEYIGDATNNVAELTAIERVLDLLSKNNNQVIVYTYSKYSIGVLTGFKVKKNKEIIDRIKLKMLKFPHLKFEYVKGHSGIELNELADKLAGNAMRTKTTTQKVFGV